MFFFIYIYKRHTYSYRNLNNILNFMYQGLFVVKYCTEGECYSYIPVQIPMEKKRKSTLGEIVLSISPKAASTAPAIVTARQPYLLVSPLAMGPVEMKNK